MNDLSSVISLARCIACAIDYGWREEKQHH